MNFNCEDCGLGFDSFRELRLHTAQHRWGPHKVIQKPSGPVFVCLHADCNKVITSNRKVLRKHLISHLNPTFMCTHPGCNKSFHENSKLKRHFLVHNGFKQYKCSFEGCDKMFAYKANMKTHLRTHTGQRPFKCTWPGCNKTFTQASNRSTHMNVHRKQDVKRKLHDMISSDEPLAETQNSKTKLKRKSEDVCLSNEETTVKQEAIGINDALSKKLGNSNSLGELTTQGDQRNFTNSINLGSEYWAKGGGLCENYQEAITVQSIFENQARCLNMLASFGLPLAKSLPGTKGALLDQQYSQFVLGSWPYIVPCPSLGQFSSFN